LPAIFRLCQALTRKRVSAEHSALAAVGRRPPPQRHAEPLSGERVWGAQLPTFL
jgi:hypothetical protein